MPINNMKPENSKMSIENIYNNDKDSIYDPLDFEVESIKS